MWTNVCPINHKQRNKILGTSWMALGQVGWVFFWSGGKEINQTLWPKSRFCHSIRHWELWGPVDWCWGPVEWVGDQLNGYFCDKVEMSWSEFAKIRWNPTAKFATLPLTRALYEFGDQLNGLGTSWMGWGPVEWYSCDKVERSWSKFAEIRWKPMAKFATLSLTRALYEFGDQLNGLGTSWIFCSETP